MKYFDNPKDEDSPFIYGPTVTMLVEGGPWRKDVAEPGHYGIDHATGKPRWKPRAYYHPYSGDRVTEPDPKVSNIRWTGTLIRHMALQGFSPDRIAHHLLLPSNKGGAFFRFELSRCPDSDFLMRMIKGSYAPSSQTPICNTYLPVGLGITDSKPAKVTKWEKAPAWRNVEGSKVIAEDASRVLLYVYANPDCLMQNITDAKVIHGRKLRNVLAALEDAGLLLRRQELVTCKGGRKRRLNVYRAAQSLPADASVEDRQVFSAVDPSPSANLLDLLPGLAQ